MLRYGYDLDYDEIGDGARLDRESRRGRPRLDRRPPAAQRSNRMTVSPTTRRALPRRRCRRAGCSTSPTTSSSTARSRRCSSASRTAASAAISLRPRAGASSSAARADVAGRACFSAKSAGRPRRGASSTSTSRAPAATFDLRPTCAASRDYYRQRARPSSHASELHGTTTTYGDAGHALTRQPARGSAPSATAMNRNPIPIVLPCHRVIGASDSLTGYGGGLDRKEHLLRLEGAIL